MTQKNQWPIIAAIGGTVALILFCGCGGLIGLLVLNSGGNSNQQAAIRYVLDTDHQLATSVTGTTASELATSVRSYVSQANSMDMSNCPPDFKVAYRRHLEAWSRAASAIDMLPDGFIDGFFMGAMNSLLRGEMDGGQSRFEGSLATADEDIRTTWYSVEDVALSYGVAR